MENDGQPKPVLKDSIRKGIAIEGAAKFLVVIRHLVLLPIFLKIWGAEVYGEWVILTALATMLELARFGIGTATNNELVGCLERHERDRFNLVFWSGALPLGGVVLLISCLGITIYLSGWDIHTLLPNLKMTSKEANIVLACSIVKIGGGIFSAIPMGALFAIKGFSFVRTWTVVSQVVVLIVAVSALFLGASPTTLAIVFAILIWILSLAATFTLTLFQTGIGKIPKGFRQDFKKTWQRLFSPSLAFFLLPCISLIIQQVPTLIIGSVLGGVSVAAFSACRTLTNGLFQGLTLVTSPSWRSITASAAAKDWDRVNMIMGRILLYTSALVAIGGLMMFFLGDLVFKLWLGDDFQYDPWIFRGLIACVAVAAFANVFGLLAHATNRNFKMSLRTLVWVALTMGVAWLVVRQNPSTIFVVVGLFIARLGQLLIAWRQWSKLRLIK